MSGTSTIVASLALGLAAGLLSGMFGIGGGLVIVPALIFLFGDSAKTAIGTSLFALVWPVGFLGVLEFWRRGEVRPIQGIWIAVGLFVGAYFGARITGALPATSVKRIYGVFLLIMGVYFLYSAQPSSESPAAESAPVKALPVRPVDQVH